MSLCTRGMGPGARLASAGMGPASGGWIPELGAVLRRWTGSAWAAAKLMVWTGTWTPAVLKRSDGGWQDVDTTGA